VELIKAVSDGNLEKVKSILSNPGIDVNQEMKFENGQKGSLLLWAIQNGNYEMTKMMIHDYNADVNGNADLDGRMTSILIATMTFCLQR
jgi:ankyrin repeat protein